MNTNSPRLYQKYVDKMQAIADLKYAAALLQWDQETYMPPKSADRRAQQLATLTTLAHAQFTDTELKQTIVSALALPGLTPDQHTNLVLTKADIEKAEKLPTAFVQQLSEATSTAFQAWIAARNANQFSVFEPALTALVNLKQQQAEYIGYSGHRYDALMDEFEKGATVAQLDSLFAALEKPLRALIAEVTALPAPDIDWMSRKIPEDQQWAFCIALAKELGYDFDAGRQDKSEHPFTINFSATDVRITTRVDECDFANMLWSTLHEVGHALYEQGLPDAQYGLPLGEYTSLSIHESQSRLWENNIGRSRAFWAHYLPKAQAYMPALADVSIDRFFQGINRVGPSLIRTEADELTYHFHVMIRYTLEKQLIHGDLKVKELPEAWNAAYQQYLGVQVPDDKQGCLQDVHWSHGSFGYFPTYSLGSFYAAQLHHHFAATHSDWPAALYTGNTQPLLDWLRQQIHSQGRRYLADELCKTVTGSGLSVDYFMQYAREKWLQ